MMLEFAVAGPVPVFMGVGLDSGSGLKPDVVRAILVWQWAC